MKKKKRRTIGIVWFSQKIHFPFLEKNPSYTISDGKWYIFRPKIYHFGRFYTISNSGSLQF